MARPELPGAAVPIQPPVSPFRWAARTRFSSLLPKCSFIFRMVVVYWSWNCESCPEIKYFSLFLRTALLFQLIPVRGRKQNILLLLDVVCNFNLSPQGDGNLSACKSDMLENFISTYPRKGTETACSQSSASSCHHFNLSPQGDGNSKVAMNPLGWTNFNLSPQGDGNGTNAVTFQTGQHFNLSPQGDGNTSTCCEPFIFLIFQLIPARGQKTPHQKRCGVFLLRALTFRFSWAFFL